MDETQANRLSIRRSRAEAALHEFQKVDNYTTTPPSFDQKPLRHTSSTRLHLPRTTFTSPIPASICPQRPSSETVLYLAYGSNLSTQTFRFPRNIHPLSSTIVHVPSLSLSFNLPGLPYSEPCFANTQTRKLPSPPAPPTTPLVPLPPRPSPRDPRKEVEWTKGLVGIVYELTREDYKIVIATEGGGASYLDILVPCFVIPSGVETVDPVPRSVPFLAHTLFAPPVPPSASDLEAQTDGASPTTYPVKRPHSSDYSQPSRRYLNILVAGAAEHGLPRDYQTYLQSLHPYHITTRRQLVGRWVAVNFWHRITRVLFLLGRILADERGRYPAWYALLLGWWFGACWAWYDSPVGERLLGDGERTEGDEWEEYGWYRDVEKGPPWEGDAKDLARRKEG